jgi:hypothetical protein
MPYTLRQFDTAEEAVDYLNNVVQGKPLPLKIMGLHGLTLKVNPAGTLRTVTFSDPTGAGLTTKEVIAQIEAVNADMVGIAAFRNYRAGQTFHLTFHSAGDVIDKTGTANPVLGFPSAADTTVGANAVALADIASFATDESGNKFTVVHQ